MNKRFIFSYFILSLETRQFFREKYGYYRKKQLLRLFNSSKSPLSFYIAGLRLEMHLSKLLINASVVPSYSAARQLIAHGHVLINNNIISSTTYDVKMGDIISLNTTAGRSLVNMYWVQGIEKFFLESLQLRNYRIKNTSDKSGAMIPLYNKGVKQSISKLDKWRNISSIKYWRSGFTYGSVKYKNSSSHFIDSISKRYEDWTYKEHRWFPPYLKKEKEKMQAFKRRNYMKSLTSSQLRVFLSKRKQEIIAKRKKRNRMLWSLNLAKQNKIKEGRWTRPSRKGLQLFLKNTHSMLFIKPRLSMQNKKFVDSRLLKGVNGLRSFSATKNFREPLKFNFSFHDKRYKKLSLYLRRNSKNVLRRYRSNTTKDSFRSFLFSGVYSSRWFSFSRLRTKRPSKKVGLFTYSQFKRVPRRKRKSIIYSVQKKAKFMKFSPKQLAEKVSRKRPKKRTARAVKFNNVKNFFFTFFKSRIRKLKKSKRGLSRYRKSKFSRSFIYVKGKGKQAVQSKQLSRKPYYFKLRKRLKNSLRITNRLTKNKISITSINKKAGQQLFADPRKSFYPKVVKQDFRGLRVSNSFESFLRELNKKQLSLYSYKGSFFKTYQALSPLKIKARFSIGSLLTPKLNRLYLLQNLLKEIRNPNDFRLHRFFIFYRSKILEDINEICYVLLKVQSSKKKLKVAVYKLLGLIGATLSHPLITSLFNKYKHFQMLRSRLFFNRSRSIINRTIVSNHSVSKKFLRKAILKGVKLYRKESTSIVQRVKSAAFFFQWKYFRDIRVKHFYKWQVKSKKFSFDNTFRYKKTSFHKVMYHLKHLDFLSLLKRSSHIPKSIFGQGHPLKPRGFSVPAKKEKSIKRRLLNKKRLVDKGFLGWKGRFRYWYRKYYSRNRFIYKSSVSNKYSFKRLHKSKYFTLYTKSLNTELKHRFFSNLYFLGRLNQAQNDLLFRLPPKFLEVDPKQLSFAIIRYPYPTELFKDIPIKVPRAVLAMFFQPKH
jgi:ribosomal protein S4